MDIIQIIISIVISTGVATVFINHWYDKKLRTHEIKIKKYIKLGEELAKLTGNEADWDQLRASLNEGFFFASDEVIGEILEFNRKFTKGRESASGGNFQMTAKDLQPLIVAIRKDLYLKSKSIEEKGLTFFQKP
mgnify:CR=1 FL=1